MQTKDKERNRVICILPNDPIESYYDKGEIKERYFNPCDIFNEVHVLSPSNADIAPEKVRTLAGKARLRITPIGEPRISALLSQGREVLNAVRNIRPCVLRAYSPLITGYYAVYCGRRLGTPSVVSLHGDYDDERRFRRKFNSLSSFLKYYLSSKITESFVLKNASKIVCVTSYVANYALRHGARDVAVIYNRVDSRRFTPATGRRRGPVAIILSVGRLNRQKNQECLIRAAKDLDVQLILIGRGELETYLKDLVKCLGVSERVSFIPSVSHDRIHEYYQQADIFAIATYYEGFCIPVLEAMSSGLPVVASDIPPLREVLDEAGVLVENVPEAFREALAEMTDNPSLRNELGSRARKRAEELDGCIMEEKEASMYLELLERSGGN